MEMEEMTEGGSRVTQHAGGPNGLTQIPSKALLQRVTL